MATLLYVDDDSQRLQVLPARLELLGYEVFTANNGLEALEIFKHRRFDLAIVDYYMPGMGGDILALEMKRTRSDVPIIMFSGTFRLPEMVISPWSRHLFPPQMGPKCSFAESLNSCRGAEHEKQSECSRQKPVARREACSRRFACFSQKLRANSQ